MYKKIFNTVGRDGVVHERKHKPPASYVSGYQTTEDGTNYREIWFNPNHPPSDMPYTPIDKGPASPGLN